MRNFARAASLFAFAATLAACSGHKAEEQEAAQATEPAAAVADSTGAEPATTEAATAAASATPEATGEATPAAAASTASPAQAAASPPPAFAQCRSCHSTEPGKSMIGPSLAGIFGTKAGEVAGYNFSTAMKESGLTWDEATLDKFLKSPREVISGTKMTFPGIPDQSKRAEVIAYLKSLK
jgi:cytochrome c2